MKIVVIIDLAESKDESFFSIFVEIMHAYQFYVLITDYYNSFQIVITTNLLSLTSFK